MNDHADRAKAIAADAQQLAYDAISVKVRISLEGMLGQLLPDGVDQGMISAVHAGLISASLTDLWNRASTHPVQRAATLREMFWSVGTDIIHQLVDAEAERYAEPALAQADVLAALWAERSTPTWAVAEQLSVDVDRARRALDALEAIGKVRQDGERSQPHDVYWLLNT